MDTGTLGPGMPQDRHRKGRLMGTEHRSPQDKSSNEKNMLKKTRSKAGAHLPETMTQLWSVG